MTTWRHSRKGIIHGTEVGGTPTWMDIKLNRAHRFGISVDSRVEEYDEGEVIAVRKQFLTIIEVPEEGPSTAP